MNRSNRTVTAVLAALALGVAALGASTPAPKQPAAKQPAATTGHEHHGAAAKPSKGALDKGKFMTITGEVMDPACFLEAGAKSIGEGHFQCAVDCARSGQTLAIYDRAADRIYFIAGELPGKNPNDPVMRYIHKKVDVSGTVYHRAQAWGIVITKVALHDAGAAAPASAPAAGK